MVAGVVSIDTLSSSANSSFIFPAKHLQMECAHEHKVAFYREPGHLPHLAGRVEVCPDGVGEVASRGSPSFPANEQGQPASSPYLLCALPATGVTGGSESQSSAI